MTFNIFRVSLSPLYGQPQFCRSARRRGQAILRCKEMHCFSKPEGGTRNTFSVSMWRGLKNSEPKPGHRVQPPAIEGNYTLNC